jgi:hypothetical protein
LTILPRPVKPRASRSADIVASVPDETSRTISTDGSSRAIVSAISISISVGAPNESPFGAMSTTAFTTAGCA